MGYYLLDHPPASRQFYPSRANQPTGGVGVHTTEGALDRILPDLGAENVAGFISRRPDPGSYSEIVDLDTVVQMVPDHYTTFSVAQAGYNSRTWNIALAARASDLHPDDPDTKRLVARLGDRIRAYWIRNGRDPSHGARWIGTGALNSAGLFNHGDVQPQDRSDAWARHPHRAALDLMLVQAIVIIPSSQNPAPGGHMILDTVTIPRDAKTPDGNPYVLAGCGVEVRMVGAAYGTALIRWQPKPGASFGDWMRLPVSSPPFAVDSVNLRSSVDGGLEVLCWNSTALGNGVIRAWQSAPGGGWVGWAAA